MFRLVVLDPGLLDRVQPTAPSTIWRSALRDAGFLAEPPGETPSARGFHGVRVELEALDAAEVQIIVASQPIAWLTGGVPRWVIWMGVVVFVVIAQLAWETGLFAPIVAGVATPVLLAPLALAGLGWAVWMDVGRRAHGRQSEVARRRHGQALFAHVLALSLSSFLLPSGSVLLVSAPHLAWIGHRLRDLRVSRPPDPSAERDELVAQLGVVRDQMEAALRAAASGAGTAPEALQCDLRVLNQRFSSLAVPPERSGEGARLAAELAKRSSSG